MLGNHTRCQVCSIVAWRSVSLVLKLRSDWARPAACSARSKIAFATICATCEVQIRHRYRLFRQLVVPFLTSPYMALLSLLRDWNPTIHGSR